MNKTSYIDEELDKAQIRAQRAVARSKVGKIYFFERWKGTVITKLEIEVPLPKRVSPLKVRYSLYATFDLHGLTLLSQLVPTNELKYWDQQTEKWVELTDSSIEYTVLEYIWCNMPRIELKDE